MRIPILYRDDDLVVVDKPIGVPTHAADASDPYPADALRAVQRQLDLAYLGMHQRLDAETSGVLLFSARPAANPALAAAFEGRDVHKGYLALVRGAPPRAEGVIVAPIARDRDGRYRVVPPGDRRGQPARTRYRLLEHGEGMSLLEVVPETGRTHQIRVHLAHLGAPVLGDPLYNSAGPVAPRLCLHAHRLELPHPSTGERMAFTAPPPATFQELRSLDRLRKPPLNLLLHGAVERRAPLAADPDTTLYRLIHAGADGLPGVTTDRYGGTLVLSLYTEDDLFPPRPVARGLLDALVAATGIDTVYVKYRPRQASRLTGEQLAALAPAEPVAGPRLDEVIAREDGLTYIVRPGDGLNAGLFPDMREGRGRVRAWSAGRRVLNCFAYTCGFGVAATAGGATRVLNLDLSKTMLARGQENYRANGFAPDPHDFVFGDVFDWLRRLARRGDRFDLVILDPPGFATSKAGRFSAARNYGELAALAAGCVAPDGLLLACCNVAELPWRKYRDQVLTGVASAGRAAHVAGVYHEPALDFPCFSPTEPYLKMLLLRLA